MRNGILTDEQINQRCAAMDAMTDEQIFRKAAEIINNDPFLTQGSYLTRMVKSDYAHQGWRPSWMKADAQFEWPEEPVNCHCLEGSIHEAVGIYAVDTIRPGYLIDVGAIAYHFDKTRSKAINQILVQVVPLNRLASIATDARNIYTVLRDSTAVVYALSDFVLAPLGKEGVRLAARYLTDAADLAAELAKETS